MIRYPLAALTGRYWRMLGIRWQHRPFESGSHVTGGRWNPIGTPALYLSADYATAIEEAQQDIVRPGTLVAFDVAATAVADLTRADPAIAHCQWRELYGIRKETPPTWPIVGELIGAGTEGALVPSVQRRGGINLVLWRWYDVSESGQGAALTLLDPEGSLRR